MNKQMKHAALLLAVLIGITGCASAGGQGADAGTAGGKRQVVNVYTARHYEVDSALFRDFTERTGISVNEIKGTPEELVEKMRQEGGLADLFVAVDGGSLQLAKQSGVLQPMESEVVKRQVPAQWRDSEGYWTGIASRSRVIVYAKDRVRPEELSTYEELTDERWRGRVLARSSASLYNQSLLASFIRLHGEAAAGAWAKGIARNLARQPEGGDRAQAKAIADKVGDVAIMNTYYIGQMLASQDPGEKEIADKIGVFFPNQETTGTHANISGIGLAKHAPNRDNAVRLAEYLTSPEGQTLLINGSYEFPVNASADMPELLRSWQQHKRQELDIAGLGNLHERAAVIFERSGWK